MEKYQKVLELMKAKGGRITGTIDAATGLVIWEDDLRTLLGNVLYRLPTYISRIREEAHLEVTGIRQGRKVVVYELAALSAEPTTETAVAVTPELV